MREGQVHGALGEGGGEALKLEQCRRGVDADVSVSRVGGPRALQEQKGVAAAEEVGEEVGVVAVVVVHGQPDRRRVRLPKRGFVAQVREADLQRRGHKETWG